MAIPFIIAGVAALAGAYGAKKGYDGYQDTKEAGRVNEKAQYIYDKAEYSLNERREDTDSCIKELGELKINIYEGNLTTFIQVFKRLKNKSELQKLINEKNELQTDNFNYDELSTDVLNITSIIGTSALSAGAGAAAGFGAFGGAGMFAAASTGTAISSLGGVAATNATLAWFGGGSLAAGGLGMAGGTMVLGGIVAGPVLAVAGSVFAAKAEEAKNNAYSNLEKARAAVEEMNAAEEIVRAINLRVTEMTDVLENLNTYLDNFVVRLEQLINGNNDYAKYDNIEKAFTMNCCNLVQTIKSICDAPVLDKDGEITKKSEDVLKIASEFRAKLEEV